MPTNPQGVTTEETNTDRLIIIIREIRLVELDRLGVVQCNKITSNVVKHMQFDAEFQAVLARNIVSSPHRSGIT